mgnify:CR=1 FL=1
MPDKWIQLSANIAFRFQYNGHIIGATFIELDINEKRFVFSGDIGRANDYLLDNPKKPEWADFLFIESTYGNKLHPDDDIEAILSQMISETIQKCPYKNKSISMSIRSKTIIPIFRSFNSSLRIV